MTDAIKLTCEEYVTSVAAAVPGVSNGGGASALVGALGLALGNMVGSLTVARRDVPELVELNEQAQALERQLLDLVAADAAAFAPLSACYSMPKSTPEELEARNAALSKALVGAIETPLAIMKSCCQAISMLKEYGERGTKLAISDVGCGAACCKAALEAASLNVFINTKLMPDRELAERYNEQAKQLLDEYPPMADAIFNDIRSRFMC